ncbi:AEC family transporter [Salinarimonas ramus]|uniref:Transporter n=1 Tax=Salinarimonas ramus TaxID=690164 RepID=A0A917Q731_9HYPH|nr:AEC family transporter [Salinarimonas ramus]GGK31789.1 transporter [Salinarimonas ramus]
MLAALLVVLPIFGLVLVGFAARKGGIIDEAAGAGLSQFVFAIALPCLILDTLARGDLPIAEPWGYWASYFVALGLVWLATGLLARHAFGRIGVETVVAGFSSAQSNTVLIGVPLILKAFGDAAAVPVFLLVAVHLPITMSVATLLVEGRGASILAIVRKLVTHPIIIGIAIGAAIRPVADVVPEPAWRMTGMLADAAAPAALVAMGVALARYGFEAGWPLPIAITTAKLVVHPLLVWLLASFVFPVPPAWIPVAVMFAACPAGINVFLLAQTYRSGVALASSTVALSTALAVLTMAGWLALVAP